MEEVLHLKFKQYPSLWKLFLRTGFADIAYWSDGSLGEGANELGKSLVRLKERLRQESENRL